MGPHNKRSAETAVSPARPDAGPARASARHRRAAHLTGGAGGRERRLLSVAQEGLWECDLHSGAVWYSARLLAMLGYQPDEQVGDPMHLITRVHPDDRATVHQAFDGLLACGTPFTLDLRALTADQQWRWVRVSAQALPGPPGRPGFLCGSTRDVHHEQLATAAIAARQDDLQALALAEQRRQAAERANAAKSDFLAHMSHEIRTPLAGVLGLTELALRTDLSGEQRRYLEAAHESGQSLLRVITDVLDLSRIEAGQVDLRAEAFDPAEAMASTVRSVMPVKHNRQLLLLFDWESDAGMVLGDPGALRQIVTNLLGNAVKFTPQGVVTLKGQAWHRPDGWVALQITVADTGPGIAPEHRAAVFEPFVQADPMARGKGGAGLGLAIARRLADAMGASLTLGCPEAGGSVFTLSVDLPTVPTPASGGNRPPCAPVNGTAWLAYQNPVAGGWLAGRLARLGWTTRVVAGVDAAIALAQDTRQTPPDLLLVPESAVPQPGQLASLRQALPGAVMRMLVNPPWHHPVLEAEAQALGIPRLVAPFTPEQLARIATDPVVPAASAPSPQPLAGEPAGRAAVLLVEDDPVSQLVMQEFLRALGLDVRLAETGQAAITACMAHPPQLVLMDLQLPDLDGLQAARRLRVLQQQGAWPGAPIVALTAHAGASDRAACRAAGMAGMLTKPMSLATLRKRLGRWLPV
jgi:PAS domain S-box-containing protein